MAGAAGLAVCTVAIDKASGYDLIPKILTGTPTGAQAMLGTISTAMITMASLVLSLTLVAVQLAMGQFSPRIVRALLSNRRGQLAIGMLLATFVFSLLVVNAVDDQKGQVPGLSVLTALLLAVTSVAGLVLYVHHTGQSLRVAGLVDLVGDELRAQLEKRYPDPLEAELPEHAEGRVVRSPVLGMVHGIDHDELVAAAREAGCCLELVPLMGDPVPGGGPLFKVHGEPRALDEARLRDAVELGSERTHEDDPSYGFRKLVDMAERATADPFDDPTTTVQVIHRLHDCLRHLATHRFPDGRFHDEHGELRLVVRQLDWNGYVQLAFDELRLAGAASPQVSRRLVAALEDLIAIAPPERQAPLEEQLHRLRTRVREVYDDEGEAEMALVPDQQGIGSGRDVTADGYAAELSSSTSA